MWAVLGADAPQASARSRMCRALRPSAARWQRPAARRPPSPVRLLRRRAGAARRAAERVRQFGCSWLPEHATRPIAIAPHCRVAALCLAVWGLWQGRPRGTCTHQGLCRLTSSQTRRRQRCGSSLQEGVDHGGPVPAETAHGPEAGLLTAAAPTSRRASTGLPAGGAI